MQIALVILLAVLASAAAVVLGFGARTELRRRPASRSVAVPDSSPVVVLTGETLFVERIDSFTVGVDCLLAATPAGEARMPVQLVCYCPLLRWHQAMALVASLVGRWALAGDPLAVEVLATEGRCPRLRLRRDRSAVVLDVENGDVIGPLLGRPAAAGVPAPPIP
jgi:hypothetical protein